MSKIPEFSDNLFVKILKISWKDEANFPCMKKQKGLNLKIRPIVSLFTEKLHFNSIFMLSHTFVHFHGFLCCWRSWASLLSLGLMNVNYPIITGLKTPFRNAFFKILYTTKILKKESALPLSLIYQKNLWKQASHHNVLGKKNRAKSKVSSGPPWFWAERQRSHQQKQLPIILWANSPHGSTWISNVSLNSSHLWAILDFVIQIARLLSNAFFCIKVCFI